MLGQCSIEANCHFPLDITVPTQHIWWQQTKKMTNTLLIQIIVLICLYVTLLTSTASGLDNFQLYSNDPDILRNSVSNSLYLKGNYIILINIFFC